MKRARVLVLLAAMAAGIVPPASAGSLLQSATRLAQQAARELPAAPAGRGDVRRSATAVAQDTPADSGMSRRKKFWIVAVGLVAAAAGMYAIDRSVEDNTPSTKGTRKD